MRAAEAVSGGVGTRLRGCHGRRHGPHPRAGDEGERPPARSASGQGRPRPSASSYCVEGFDFDFKKLALSEKAVFLIVCRKGKKTRGRAEFSPLLSLVIREREFGVVVKSGTLEKRV